MSRRPNPAAAKAADKAAANQAVIKSLLKLPGNKICADCKRNKLPRWASWNLGLFICIRCSGIHRGMGTHISKVKSVDLDTWTDEQLASMLKWGNTKANKYWEANLAPGHVPSEAKIENFVRTKYDAKRWVMEGGMPDPSTLDDSGEEDNLPLNVVQQKLENRQISSPTPQQAPKQQQNINLFDDLSPMELPRSTTAPPGNKNQPSPKSAPAPPKSTKPADSLLGLDFFGSSDPTPARPASVNSNPVTNTASSRPDLNRSILSLYASKPQPRTQHAQNSSFSGMSQPSVHQHTVSSGLGDLNDAFGGLGFSSQSTGPSISTIPVAQSTAPKPSPFANLTAGMMKSSAGSQLSPTSSNGFFGSSTSTKQSIYSKTTGSSAMDDLFDFSSTPAPALAAPAISTMSAFNLTATNATTPKQPTTPQFSFDANAWAAPAATISTASNNESAWGTSIGSASIASNAWGSPATTSVSKPPTSVVGISSMAPPKSSEDDEWGAFSTGGAATSGAPVQTTGFGQDDLFGNVWK
ncbi:ArfGap-domain-containing protein [Morchella conica CCBAS932]|uniref:ArfGap-domain-containing protein n=1 Tax=Morchella conica CCBAS932 TaxID=1392247 RepID=A0A3N4LFX4_9PEZI|nr:ArfGap-domain-containing protein [Morchella conica CCBAS932]